MLDHSKTLKPKIYWKSSDFRKFQYIFGLRVLEWPNVDGVGYAVRNRSQTTLRASVYQGLVGGSFMFGLRGPNVWIFAQICRRLVLHVAYCETALFLVFAQAALTPQGTLLLTSIHIPTLRKR